MISFVVPVKNGERWLGACLDAIAAQRGGRPFEVLVVDDGSTDRSPAIAAEKGARVIAGPRRGAAAAINRGLAEARYPLVAQIDQDVVLAPNWLDLTMAELTDPRVAAVQGQYVADGRGSLLARVMDLDLRLRYSRIRGRGTNHVCTGNSIYRTQALRDIGGFDETFGYGYDNDVSYRLAAAGHLLSFCRDAQSVHHWKNDLRSYARQQYGFGYGRLDLVGKHPRRMTGDQVSGALMMLHAPMMLLALVLLACGQMRLALAVVAALAVERTIAGVIAWRRLGGAAGLLFAPVHLLRDLAWAWAITVWMWRQLWKRPRRPQNSMA